MFYDKTGEPRQGLMPNHPSRLPEVTVSSYRGQRLIVRMSASIVPVARYDIAIGRGSNSSVVALIWDEFGEYGIKMGPKICVARLAPFNGVKRGKWRSVFTVGRKALYITLPPAKHEIESWWQVLPDVSDNPSEKWRKIADDHNPPGEQLRSSGSESAEAGDSGRKADPDMSS